MENFFCPGSAGSSANFGAIVVSAFVLSVVLVVSGYLRAPERKKLNDPFGAPNWDFRSSWASNVTVIGALLTGVMAFMVNPTECLKEGGYQAASLFFATIVSAAPAVYSFYRDFAVSEDAAVPPRLRGFVIGFLVASVFTLFGVTGQLGTLAVLVVDLHKGGTLPYSAAWTFDLLLASLLMGLMFYAVRTIPQLLQLPTKTSDVRRRARAAVDERTKGALPEHRTEALVAELAGPALPSWPLL